MVASLNDANTTNDGSGSDAKTTESIDDDLLLPTTSSSSWSILRQCSTYILKTNHFRSTRRMGKQSTTLFDLPKTECLLLQSEYCPSTQITSSDQDNNSNSAEAEGIGQNSFPDTSKKRRW